MDRMKKRTIIRVVKLLNILAIVAIFSVVWFGYYHSRIGVASPRRFGAILVFMYAILYYFFAHIYEGLQISLAKPAEIIFSQALSLLFADGILFVLVWLLGALWPGLLPMGICFGLQLVFVTAWANFAHWMYYKLYNPRKTVTLYKDLRDLNRMQEMDKVSRKFEVCNRICVQDSVDEDVLSQLEGMDAVFVRGLPTNERNEVLKYCVQNGIEVYLWPKIGDVMLCGVEHTHMFHVPIMRLKRYEPHLEYLMCKRLIDICASLAGIIVLGPFMLGTALAIKLYDGGPALYRQVRLTQNGREFEILKFRSMRVDAEKDGVARLSTGDADDRITPVGKVIRAIRFDELPQLFNILKGEMSVVGPRPERPEIAAQYVQEMPEFDLRLQAKAGLTGYAQVYGKYNTTPYDKLQMDLLYISRPSVLEDIKIILATIKVLFMKESTEGVQEGQITASGNVPVEEEKEEAETVAV